MSQSAISSDEQRWWAAYALLPSGVARDVTFEVAGGRFTAVRPESSPGDAQVLPGVVLPGFANAHSHAFHRALRGRTHDGGGTFWTWRERMYAVAAQLDPDSYLALATATYAEMALAGITTVGEFHYLHHAPGGASYDDPNAMGEALRQAAADAGIRLTLLDTCYVAGGLDATGHSPLDKTQLRFGDGDAARWAERVAGLAESDGMRVGAAIHSVRAVPSDQLGVVARAAAGRPLHVHLSEQPAENEACQGFYDMTPTALLDVEGVLGPRTTVVHATHLTDADIATLGSAGTTVCRCPTTERWSGRSKPSCPRCPTSRCPHRSGAWRGPRWSAGRGRPRRPAAQSASCRRTRDRPRSRPAVRRDGRAAVDPPQPGRQRRAGHGAPHARSGWQPRHASRRTLRGRRRALPTGRHHHHRNAVASCPVGCVRWRPALRRRSRCPAGSAGSPRRPPLDAGPHPWRSDRHRTRLREHGAGSGTPRPW